MTSITQLKDAVNTKTWNLVLLTVATAGIYQLLWMWRHTPVISSITKKQITDDVFLIWLAVCVGLSAALAGLGEPILDLISALISFASSVLYIVWAFKARASIQEYALLEHKVDLRMNGFYTFLFTVFYINYCINDLEEAKRKQNIISSNQPDSAQN